MSSQKKILLTGAEGYVGGLVLGQLETLVRFSYMNPLIVPDIYVKPLYFLDHQSIRALSNEKFDYIFHCAVVGGRSFEVDEPSIFERNIEMFNLLKQLNFDKIIHFTSAADFGRENDILDELPERVLTSEPTDYFGKSKRFICEEIIKGNLGINLRIFNVFGRSEVESENFIDGLVKKLGQNEDYTIKEDRLFDIFYVENLRPIIVKIINNEMDTDYNLVYGQKQKISDYVNFIKNTINSESIINVAQTGKSYTGKNTTELVELEGIDPFNELLKYLTSCNLSGGARLFK